MANLAQSYRKSVELVKKKQFIFIIGFLILVLSLFLVWFFTRPAPLPRLKTITLEVVHGDGTTSEFTVNSDSDNLRGALDQVDGLLFGEESIYGLMVQTVDGETADWNRDQSWWCLTKNGEWLDTGVSDTMIADGDHYEFTYTIG